MYIAGTMLGDTLLAEKDRVALPTVSLIAVGPPVICVACAPAGFVTLACHHQMKWSGRTACMLCTLRAGRIDMRATNATCSMNHDVQPTNVGRIGRQDFLTSNLHAGVAKTLGVPKAMHVRSAISSHTSLYTTHASPGILPSATSLPYMFCSPIARSEG